jgi:hypothetical protein
MIKKFTVAIIGIEIVSAFSLSPVVFAQGKNQNATSSASDFCSGLVQRISSIDQKASSQLDTLKQNDNDKDSRVKSGWDKFVSDKNTAYAKQDADLDARVQKLSSTAKSDSEKQATAAFQTAVKVALAAKRLAFDAVIKTFQDGVSALLSARKTATEAAFTARADAFRVAAQKAQADCASGVSVKTVRAAFLAAVKDAEKKFVSARKADNDFKTKMQALTAVKKAAMDKAQNGFKAALDSAKAALKAAFGVSPTSTNQ